MIAKIKNELVGYKDGSFILFVKCRNIEKFIHSILLYQSVLFKKGFVLQNGPLNHNLIKEKMEMYQYTISIMYQGKQYQTNVIASKESSEQEIYQLALEQVQMQWGLEKEHS